MPYPIFDLRLIGHRQPEICLIVHCVLQSNFSKSSNNLWPGLWFTYAGCNKGSFYSKACQGRWLLYWIYCSVAGYFIAYIVQDRYFLWQTDSIWNIFIANCPCSSQFYEFYCLYSWIINEVATEKSKKGKVTFVEQNCEATCEVLNYYDEKWLRNKELRNGFDAAFGSFPRITHFNFLMKAWVPGAKIWHKSLFWWWECVVKCAFLNSQISYKGNTLS